MGTRTLSIASLLLLLPFVYADGPQYNEACANMHGVDVDAIKAQCIREQENFNVEECVVTVSNETKTVDCAAPNARCKKFAICVRGALCEKALKDGTKCATSIGMHLDTMFARCGSLQCRPHSLNEGMERDQHTSQHGDSVGVQQTKQDQQTAGLVFIICVMGASLIFCGYLFASYCRIPACRGNVVHAPN